jgi:hypothetical protein
LDNAQIDIQDVRTVVDFALLKVGKELLIVRRIKPALMLATVVITTLVVAAPAWAVTIFCSGGLCEVPPAIESDDNTFFESDENDRIISGSGDDDINAQESSNDTDDVESKQGRDDINVRDGDRKDEVDCGKGNDVVRANRHDDIANNCEKVRYN